MLNSKLKFLIALLFSLSFTRISAQILHLNEKDGVKNSFEIKKIRKLTFDIGNISIQNKDNSISLYELNRISYINFENKITQIDVDNLSENTINIYPNPVNNVFNITLNGTTDKGIIQIMTIDGKLLIEEFTEGKNLVTINLETFSKGVYLCRFVSDSISKTIKIDKL